VNFGLTDAFKQLEESSQNLEILIKEQRYNNALLEKVLLSLNKGDHESTQTEIENLKKEILN
jgi:hypothetical protein